MQESEWSYLDGSTQNVTMVKEGPRKPRPKSMYDNVQYSPDSPPSWQYYRCMAVVIKMFELIFALLVFVFAAIWIQNTPDIKVGEEIAKRVTGEDYGPTMNYGAPVWVVLVALVSIFVTVILFMFLLCCVLFLIKKLTTWFCFEFFLHIVMIVLWFITSMICIIFAVAFPSYYIICACVFSFFAQLMYSVDCNFNFVYWRESKRRDIYKHSQPIQ